MKSELAFRNVLKDNKVFISKRNNDNTSLFVACSRLSVVRDEREKNESSLIFSLALPFFRSQLPRAWNRLACLLFLLFWSLVTLLMYFSHHVSLYPHWFFWYRKEKHKHCLSVNGFLTEKEANKTWKVYTDWIWTLNLSRDDPACIALRYLCITFKSLKVLIFC